MRKIALIQVNGRLHRGQQLGKSGRIRAAFVIARSDSDEAIQQGLPVIAGLSWIASLRSQ